MGAYVATKFLTAILVSTLLCGFTFAQMPPQGMQQGMSRPPQGGPMRDDPRGSVDQISRDLGVTPDQFRACFNDVNPAPSGSLPESNQKHTNKQVLLSCLQRVNPGINNNSLDTVMDQYRPGGRAAQ